MSNTSIEQLAILYSNMVFVLDDLEKKYFETAFPIYRKQKAATIQYYALKLYLVGMVILHLDIKDRKFVEKAFYMFFKKCEKKIISFQRVDSCYCSIEDISNIYKTYLTLDKQHNYNLEELAKIYINFLPRDIQKDISATKTAEILNHTNNEIARFVSFTLANHYSNQKKSSNILLETLKFGVVGTVIVGIIFFLASLIVRLLK